MDRARSEDKGTLLLFVRQPYVAGVAKEALRASGGGGCSSEVRAINTRASSREEAGNTAQGMRLLRTPVVALRLAKS